MTQWSDIVKTNTKLYWTKTTKVQKSARLLSLCLTKTWTHKSQTVTTLVQRPWIAEFEFLLWETILNSAVCEQTKLSNLLAREVTWNPRAITTQKLAKVMVRASVTADNLYLIVCINCGIKINGNYYGKIFSKENWSSGYTNIFC